MLYAGLNVFKKARRGDTGIYFFFFFFFFGEAFQGRDR